MDKELLPGLDYALLFTFVCFFVVSGNLGRMDSICVFLQNLLNKSTLLTSIGASQFISNVPSAVLLSNFTNQWQELLAGVNIGGLGTPIASLASLITLGSLLIFAIKFSAEIAADSVFTGSLISFAKLTDAT